MADPPDGTPHGGPCTVSVAEVADLSGRTGGRPQDSGYGHEDDEPYVTCWVALDDITEENRGVYLLPYSRSGSIRTTDGTEPLGENERFVMPGTARPTG